MAEGQISWKNVDNLSLGKAVANFNRKLNKIRTEENKMYLPDEINFRDVKENIYTRRELNRVIQNLRNFNKEGAEELYQNDAGENMTKWEKDIIESNIKTGIRRLNKELRQVDRNKYPFETAEEKNIKQRIQNLRSFNKVKGFDFEIVKKRAFNIGRADFEMKKAIQYKENYLKVLKEHYMNFDNYDKLMKYLEKFKNPIRFFERIEATGNENIVDIYMLYDPDMAQRQFNEFVSNFINPEEIEDS